MNDNIHPLDDFFFTCAFLAYNQALAEGKHMDKEYVRRIAYGAYEEGKHLLVNNAI